MMGAAQLRGRKCGGQELPNLVARARRTNANCYRKTIEAMNAHSAIAEL